MVTLPCSFVRAGLNGRAERASQAEFYPLPLYLPPFLFYEIFYVFAPYGESWRNTSNQQVETAATGPRAGQEAQLHHKQVLHSLWSLRSPWHLVTGRVSLGSHTRQPAGCDTASPSLEQAISPFLHLQNTPAPHRAAGGLHLPEEYFLSPIYPIPAIPIPAIGRGAMVSN